MLHFLHEHALLFGVLYFVGMLADYYDSIKRRVAPAAALLIAPFWLPLLPFNIVGVAAASRRSRR